MIVKKLLGTVLVSVVFLSGTVAVLSPHTAAQFIASLVSVSADGVVTSVDADSITLLLPNGDTLTASITVDTDVDNGPVTTGDNVRLSATSSNGTNVATSIVVRASGYGTTGDTVSITDSTMRSKTSTSLTVQAGSGPVTVIITASTTFTGGTFEALQEGQTVLEILGTDTGSSFVATSVRIQPLTTSTPTPDTYNGGRRGSNSVRPSASLPVSSVRPSPTVPCTMTFADTPPREWYTSYISILACEGIINGYKDARGNPTGFFKPDNSVTRAEIAKMTLLASDQETSGRIPANPSARGNWSAPFIRSAEDLDFSVYDPALNVHRPATRGQIVQTILEGFGVGIELQDHPFRDLPSSSQYAAAISTAYQLGIITGDLSRDGEPTGTVRPNAQVTRAEAAKIIQLSIEILK